MMKLIASDFDGTIRTDEQGNLADIQAINEWKSRGNVFAVISGRNSPDLNYMVTKYNIPADYSLGDSGNTCFKGNKLFYTMKGDADVVKPLGKYILDSGATYLIINQPEITTVVYRKARKDKPEKRIPYDEWNFDGFSQISAVYSTPEEADEVVREINEIFGGKVTAFRNDDCIDVIPDGRNKGKCLEILAERLNIEYDDIYCIGDNFNDIPMLEAFKSFAVENAEPEVKSYAGQGVVKSVAEMIRILNDL